MLFQIIQIQQYYRCTESTKKMHHLCCKRQPGALSPKSDLHAIRTWLQRNSTAPPITLAIMQGMKNWISGLPPPHFLPSTNKKIDLLINTATEEQSHIRWKEVFKGCLSSKLSEAQQAWYDSLRQNHCDLDTEFPRHYTGKVWTKQFISCLIYYNLNRWQIRNEVAHAIATAEAQAKSLAQYTDTITSLYANHTNHNQLFRMPLANLLSLPTTQLCNWLQMQEASTLYHTHTQTLNYQEEPE